MTNEQMQQRAELISRLVQQLGEALDDDELALRAKLTDNNEGTSCVPLLNAMQGQVKALGVISDMFCIYSHTPE